MANNMFYEQAKQRQAEQKEILRDIMKPDKEEKEPRVKMMLSMTQAQKDALKIYALEQHKTAAAVIQQWIDQYCIKKQ